VVKNECYIELTKAEDRRMWTIFEKHKFPIEDYNKCAKKYNELLVDYNSLRVERDTLRKKLYQKTGGEVVVQDVRVSVSSDERGEEGKSLGGCGIESFL